MKVEHFCIYVTNKHTETNIYKIYILRETLLNTNILSISTWLIEIGLLCC